jgi:hypothetical protein
LTHEDSSASVYGPGCYWTSQLDRRSDALIRSSRRDSVFACCSLPPKILEPRRRQLAIAHRVLDISRVKVGLQRSVSCARQFRSTWSSVEKWDSPMERFYSNGNSHYMEVRTFDIFNRLPVQESPFYTDSSASISSSEAGRSPLRYGTVRQRSTRSFLQAHSAWERGLDS